MTIKSLLEYCQTSLKNIYSDPNYNKERCITVYLTKEFIHSHIQLYKSTLGLLKKYVLMKRGNKRLVKTYVKRYSENKNLKADNTKLKDDLQKLCEISHKSIEMLKDENKRLVNTTVDTVYGEKKQVSGKHFCRNCSTVVRKKDKYCPNCGRKFND